MKKFLIIGTSIIHVVSIVLCIVVLVNRNSSVECVANPQQETIVDEAASKMDVNEIDSELIAREERPYPLEENHADMITDKETAIQIGKAILIEHFPMCIDQINSSIGAAEIDGVWRVCSYMPNSFTDFSATKGGGLIVEFSKYNGEILVLEILE